MNCDEHNQLASSKCTWCARSICDKCIEWAHGKKLCGRCFAKLSNEGVEFVPNRKKEALTGPISNKDPTLSEDQIQHARDQLNPESKKKKPSVQNIPDTINW